VLPRMPNDRPWTLGVCSSSLLFTSFSSCGRLVTEALGGPSGFPVPGRGRYLLSALSLRHVLTPVNQKVNFGDCGLSVGFEIASPRAIKSSWMSISQGSAVRTRHRPRRLQVNRHFLTCAMSRDHYSHTCRARPSDQVFREKSNKNPTRGEVSMCFEQDASAKSNKIQHRWHSLSHFRNSGEVLSGVSSSETHKSSALRRFAGCPGHGSSGRTPLKS
jgi:hypothetical protein